MNPYEQCFEELGITCPTIEQKRALRRLVAALAPETKVLEQAHQDAKSARQRHREAEARADVLREKIEECLCAPRLPCRVRRILEGISDATAYDGRTRREIVQAAGSVT